MASLTHFLFRFFPRTTCPTTFLVSLVGRALDRSIGAEDAAVAGFWFEPCLAPRAIVEMDAGIGRHRFIDAEAAIRFLQLKPFHEAVELTLMTVLPWTEPPWPSGAAEAAATAATQMLEKQTEYIEAVAERLCAIGYKAHGVALLGTPPTMILQQATTLRSDLILMGTRGRRGITRFVLGSTSHAVLHKTPCPVLVFHS